MPPVHPTRRSLLSFGVGLGALAALPAAAQGADDYPNRSIRLVVSYGAGNIADQLARLVAQKLSEQIGQPVVIENRPGQGGSLGAQVAAKATPDGYTLLFSAMAAIAINPHVYGRVGYDPIADLAPITAIANTRSGILYTNLDVKATTLPELVALSKASPGTLNYGTAGSGTVPHLNMELLKGMTGLDALHVPYKAAAAVMTDVIGGRIQMAQESAGVVMPQIKAGKVRALAIVGSEPMPELPGVAPITATVPAYDAVRPWMGFMAPAGVPAARIAWLDAALQRVLEVPDVRQRIAALNLELLGTGPAGYARMVRRDLDRFGPMVKMLDLKPD